MTLEVFWPLVNNYWFHMVVGGYDLTALGREEAGAGARTPAP